MLERIIRQARAIIVNDRAIDGAAILIRYSLKFVKDPVNG
jgi:hypothetical protein